MKKHIFILTAIVLLFCGCDVLEDEINNKRSINYFVSNSADGNSDTGPTTQITYLDAAGNTLFKDLRPGNFWSAVSSNFSKGDRVSLAINSPSTSGTITIRIKCDECEDLGGSGGRELVKTIDLSVIRVGEISANLD